MSSLVFPDDHALSVLLTVKVTVNRMFERVEREMMLFFSIGRLEIVGWRIGELLDRAIKVGNTM